MSQFRRLLQDQQGNVAIIAAFMILPMLILAGGATDLARYEMFRVQLQDGVDRAVLAAASLTQERGVEETAAEYLKTLSFIDKVDLDFDYGTALNERTVTIKGRYDMPTGFLPLIGINELSMVATATAQERRQQLEISLMLDMSGSMLESSPTRISLLRPAAKQFIDAMIKPDTAPYTSLSIVPYAGSVNPGQVAFGLLGPTRRHNYSSCIEFDHTGNNRDYGTGMVPFNLRAQVPHFTENHVGRASATLQWAYCPNEATSITYLSNNAAALKARIDSIQLHDGTGTAVASNWGLMLLDPSAQPFISRMAAAGQLPVQFSNRPAAFDDPDTLKVLVLMTDGQISHQRRPNKYDFPRAKEGRDDNYTLQQDTVAAATLRKVCQTAKDHGIIVFTIGFYLNSTTDMRNCASSASHFYDVRGSGISLAFQSIANTIQNLKLTQ